MRVPEMRAQRIGKTHLRVTVAGKDYSVTVPVDGFMAWQKGTLIQDAMPELSASEREFLISGLTPDEWDAMVSEDEKEYSRHYNQDR